MSDKSRAEGLVLLTGATGYIGGRPLPPGSEAITVSPDLEEVHQGRNSLSLRKRETPA